MAVTSVPNISLVEDLTKRMGPYIITTNLD